MSINDATPADWDRLRKQYPPVDDALMFRYVQEAEKELEELEDMVGSPSHYNTGNIECIEAIEESMSVEAYKGYLKGNCMKYLWRYDYKGKPAEDLQKAQWYLAKLLHEVVFEGEEDN